MNNDPLLYYIHIHSPVAYEAVYRWTRRQMPHLVAAEVFEPLLTYYVKSGLITIQTKGKTITFNAHHGQN